MSTILVTKRYVTSGGRRRREGFTARLGPVTATGATKREAQDNVLERVRGALLHVERGPRHGTFRGVSYTLSPTLEETWSIWRTGYRSDYMVTGHSSEHEALKSLYLDILQQGWSREVGSDEDYVMHDPNPLFSSVELHAFTEARREFLSWTRWQREYARLRAEGLDDNDARNKLMGYL